MSDAVADRLRRLRVAVLKGGWSRERPISLKTGAAVEAALGRLGIPFVSIDVRADVVEVMRRRKAGFAFIALHGAFGEDGGVQACLDVAGIPYTGSGALASALAMDKDLSKRLFERAGVPVAPALFLPKTDVDADPRAARARVAAWLAKGPLFIKPVDQGSAIGVSRVDRPAQIVSALKACFRVSSGALVERFVSGRELTVGILGGRTLPVVEIVPEHRFYDFHSKYAKGGSRHIVPADITPAATRRVQAAALAAFKALKCSVYGRVDVMLPRTGRPVVLEVNTIPGMTATSLLPDAARAAGMDFDRLVLRIAELSLKERGR